MKNPNWNRDELLLALDLYFRVPEAHGSNTHPEILALSDLLNKLPIHSNAVAGANFRNANSVSMKLSNFMRFDPEYKGKGLQRGSNLEAQIWKEFVLNKETLEKIAIAIRENYSFSDISSPPAEYELDDDEEANEGRVLTRVHQARERNKKIVNQKKTKVLKETGALICEACGFNFVEKYGEIGVGFAECHHIKPVSELKIGEKTKLSDLSIVCANCHRILHRQKPWLSLLELKNLIKKISLEV